MLGGFALGLSYKKYSPHINGHFSRFTDMDKGYEDYRIFHEPDA